MPGDPRLGWALPGTPVLRHRRDGILPTVAAALSLPGSDGPLTGTAARSGPDPALHPLVQAVVDGLGSEQRERHGTRCPEAALISRHLTAVGVERPGKAKRALKNARVTTRHIREEGDPQHGEYAPHCHSCTALLAHFGVRSVSPTSEATTALRLPGRRGSGRKDPEPAEAADALVGTALRKAGWEPGRRESAQAGHWAGVLRSHLSPGGHPHFVFPAAEAAWEEFGGLQLDPVRPGAECAASPVRIDPLRGLHWARTLGDLARALDTELSPLGETGHLSPDGNGVGTALLAVDREGRSYCLDHTGDWYLGPDVRTGLATLLTGSRPVRLVPPELSAGPAPEAGARNEPEAYGTAGAPAGSVPGQAGPSAARIASR